MSYLLLLPCMLGVYYQARKHDLSGSYFATIAMLMTVVLSHSEFFTAGVDTLVATCFTMCVISVAIWYVDKEFSNAISTGLVEIPSAPKTTCFYSKTNHDFAVDNDDFEIPISLFQSKDWPALSLYFSELSAKQRQGMYASVAYGKVSEETALEFLEYNQLCPDAHIFYAHLKICEAKKEGLIPGVMPGEAAAAALAVAFKHLGIARRIKPDDAESLCGLLICKGCVALRDEQIEAGLVDLLNIDTQHIHGVMSAARFLIRSPAQGDRFVGLVESYVDSDLLSAVARLVAYVESGVSSTEISSSATADMYRQLQIYRRQRDGMGSWQKAICNNVFAFAFEQIGDSDEAQRRLQELNGKSSAYPWRRIEGQAARLATLAF